MQFNGFTFDEHTQALLSELDRSRRLPHALIIESAQEDKAQELATFLSMYAVCGGEERPCGECKNCLNAQRKAHPDVSRLSLPPQKKQYTVDQMRELIKDAYILPNEAAAKVYILEKCDDRFPPLPQNTFLKLSEEPPPNVYFILLCQSAQCLLATILSRFTVLRLQGRAAFSEETLAAAKAVAQGITAATEYPLLKARLSLRDALAILSGGDALGDKETANLLAARLTRKKLLDMMELCSEAAGRLKQNANINLRTAWLCGEFRRITWQR